MKRFVWTSAAIAAALLLSGCAGATDGDGSAGETAAAGEGLEGRTIDVTTLSYYPFCGQDGDEMVGLDVDVMNAVAEKLGVEVKYSVLEAAGQIAGIESRRNDVTICDIAWTEDRSEVGLLPDPLYYVPVMLTQRADDPAMKSLSDVEGKRIGLINGYSWNEVFAGIPNAKISTYPDASSVLADLAAGRIDVAPTDPLVTDVAIAKRPDWDFVSNRMDLPTQEELAEDESRIRLLPTQAGWMVAKDEPELAAALTREIRNMYATGELAKIYQKWDVPDVEAWLTVPGDYIADQRRGVDRPDDWQPPTWP